MTGVQTCALPIYATAAQSGVNAEGDAESLLRAVLWSRLASRALWPLVAFDCASEDDLYAAVDDGLQNKSSADDVSFALPQAMVDVLVAKPAAASGFWVTMFCRSTL